MNVFGLSLVWWVSGAGGLDLGGSRRGPTRALEAATSRVETPRGALLAAIQQADDAAVERAIERIAASGAPPSIAAAVKRAIERIAASGAPSSTSDAALGGTWRLLWSARSSKFSPLLGLPKPLRPESQQQFGAVAAELVGAGRVTNELAGGVLGPARLVLSAGVAPAGSAGDLEIFPPFRLELLLGGQRATLVDAGSDAEFRATQARTKSEQLAPLNVYAQLYCETSGRGDLRVSRVTSGDPVIVGATFVHERL